jgi:hypothetical protein
LQLIHEFAEVVNKDIQIIMINSEHKIKKTSVNKELRGAYGPRTSGRDLRKYEEK